jgi:hypothetical protein
VFEKGIRNEIIFCKGGARAFMKYFNVCLSSDTLSWRKPSSGTGNFSLIHFCCGILTYKVCDKLVTMKKANFGVAIVSFFKCSFNCLNATRFESKYAA